MAFNSNKQNNEKKVGYDAILNNLRKSNIELLRIISLLLIVAVHYYTVGILRSDSFENNFNFNGILAQTLSLGGRLGNEIFILITGYFSIQSKFKIQRITKIINATHFYSWGFLLLAIIVNEEIGIMQAVRSLFPVVFSTYWFVTAFIGLMLLSPFLNILMYNLKATAQIKLILVMVLFTSVLPTITKTMEPTVSIRNLWLFVTLYLIGGFIRLNPNLLNKIGKFMLIIMTGLLNIGMILSVYLFDGLALYLGENSLIENSWFFNRQESLLLLLCSVSIFILFTRIDIGSKEWINTISATTFGVYLIHGNTFVHENLYTKILNVEKLYHLPSMLFLVITLLEIIAIFAVCSVIELLRMKVVLKINVNPINIKINQKIKKVINIVDCKFKLDN